MIFSGINIFAMFHLKASFIVSIFVSPILKFEQKLLISSFLGSSKLLKLLQGVQLPTIFS